MEAPRDEASVCIVLGAEGAAGVLPGLLPVALIAALRGLLKAGESLRAVTGDHPGKAQGALRGRHVLAWPSESIQPLCCLFQEGRPSRPVDTPASTTILTVHMGWEPLHNLARPSRPVSASCSPRHTRGAPERPRSTGEDAEAQGLCRLAPGHPAPKVHTPHVAPSTPAFPR
ncbi:unnamed protein product [Rangifer tarandus platyrhynchus]|uniref:Uncharacterized protein n=1 Tax=Rangifer tarandus platyrhynchus TaxID=3082113 RepID=A0ACB1MJY2_RANTA